MWEYCVTYQGDVSVYYVTFFFITPGVDSNHRLGKQNKLHHNCGLGTEITDQFDIETRTKIVTILESIFFLMEIDVFHSNLTEICSHGYNEQ